MINPWCALSNGALLLWPGPLGSSSGAQASVEQGGGGLPLNKVDAAGSQGFNQAAGLKSSQRLWKIMPQKAILSGGSVVVGPHDLNGQYHLTTWVCYFLNLKRMKFLWFIDSLKDRKGKDLSEFFKPQTK